MLDRVAAGVTVRAVIDAPPRHGKSETLLHSPAFLLERDPRFMSAYVTYDSQLARDMSHIARQIAQEQGQEFLRDSLRLWQTKQRGGLFVTSTSGVLTGKGFKLMIVDDTFKNRAEAESKKKRDKLKAFLTSTAFTRLEPTASVLVVGTRWHPDDAQGALIADGWEHIHLPAISDEGVALWPSKWSVETLTERRALVGEYDWFSLYQGSPRPRGGNLFGDPTTYSRLPERGTIAIGVDLSYTSKKTADYSCAVVLMRAEVPSPDGAAMVQVYYVLDVIRRQCRAPEFKAALRELHRKYPNARMRFYGSGIEQGSADFFRTPDPGANGTVLPGVPLEFMAVADDKFIRAQPVAAAWGRQLVCVPEHSTPWSNAFVSEVVTFTGVEDDHDDQVDALAAAFDLLAVPDVKIKREVREATRRSAFDSGM